MKSLLTISSSYISYVHEVLFSQKFSKSFSKISTQYKVSDFRSFAQIIECFFFNWGHNQCWRAPIEGALQIPIFRRIFISLDFSSRYDFGVSDIEYFIFVQWIQFNYKIFRYYIYQSTSQLVTEQLDLSWFFL